jgi:glutaredoxin 3
MPLAAAPTVKFLPRQLVLILVAFASGGMLVWPMVRPSGGGVSVGTSEAVRLINREKGVLIDVSEPAEFAAGHAAGARNVPLGQLEGAKACRPTRPAAGADVPVRCARRPRRRPAAQGRLRERRWRCPAAPPPGARPACRSRKRPERQRPSAGFAAAWTIRRLPARSRHSPGSPHEPGPMYTTQVCPYCVRAKACSSSAAWRQIDEIRIDLDPAQRDHMMALTGRRTVPQIFIGDTHVGGCDDLIALDQRGGLLPLLGQPASCTV